MKVVKKTFLKNDKELMLSSSKNLDFLIEQTESKSQDTLKFKFNSSRQFFCFHFRLHLEEEGKRRTSPTSYRYKTLSLI